MTRFKQGVASVVTWIMQSWQTLRCKHVWDRGTLVDCGRNKLFRCTKPGCRGIRML